MFIVILSLILWPHGKYYAGDHWVRPIIGNLVMNLWTMLYADGQLTQFFLRLKNHVSRWEVKAHSLGRVFLIFRYCLEYYHRCVGKLYFGSRGIIAKYSKIWYQRRRSRLSGWRRKLIVVSIIAFISSIYRLSYLELSILVWVIV